MRMVLVASGAVAAYSGRKVYLGREEMQYWMVTYFASFAIYAYTYLKLLQQD